MAYFGSTDNLDASDEVILGPANTDRADFISGMVFADQEGDIYIEQSADGENWDISTTYPLTASDGKGFSEPLYGAYVRVRYVNGGSDQTEFRIHARFTSAGDS